jgi:hypothetical protein
MERNACASLSKSIHLELILLIHEILFNYLEDNFFLVIMDAKMRACLKIISKMATFSKELLYVNVDKNNVNLKVKKKLIFKLMKKIIYAFNIY